MVYPGRTMVPVQDVLDLVANMTARWNAKDAAAFSQLFAEDADFTDVIGQTAHGKAAIETQHLFPFTHNMREAVLSADSTTVRPAGEDCAVVILKWTTVGNLSLDGGPVPPRKGTMQLVVHRNGAALRILSVLNQDPLGIYGKQMAERGA